ncbi:hypothetical protein O6P43_017398 [Quillaja saponaria]|uniref:Uncharacterized protein n=1 Tax=Quillaja saponaria TaxID=32244 RepID=A0AAD7PPC1_QUISA|nr:hypothetical protein O6P43_017398 [Quillaja saponaria]
MDLPPTLLVTATLDLPQSSVVSNSLLFSSVKALFLIYKPGGNNVESSGMQDDLDVATFVEEDGLYDGDCYQEDP